MKIEYLTREDLLDLHTYVVTRYGGLMGIASQDGLGSVLHAPRQAMFGMELYPDVCSKAAVLMYRIIKNYPFVSGNEGTALIALLRFLEINGFALRHDVSNGDLIRLIYALSNSDMDRESLENWLRDNVTQF